MYTRAYDDNLGIVIPESYGGTAFREEPKFEQATAAPKESGEGKRRKGESECDSLHRDENEACEQTGSFFSSLIPRGIFGNIFKNESFGLQKIGTEEILIIATAAFLLFSKDGDKECAIMLLLLLFLS